MDYVILNSDQVIFDSSFSPATIVPVPGTITASSQAQSNSMAACVVGDETSVSVPGVAYVSGAFTTPGTGTLTILSLGSDQKAKKGKSGQIPLILKGSSFRAKFQIMTPAMNTAPTPAPDPTPTYFGSGQFITTNTVFKAV